MRLESCLLGLLLSGCATLNESECRSVDWFDLGTRDGSSGYGRDRLDAHREACGEFGVATADAAWIEGYGAGLESYCEPDNAYRVGRQGGYYGKVCPLELEREFLPAYQIGGETRAVEQEMAQVGQNINALESRLASDKNLSDQARADARRQLRELDRRAAALRRARDRLEDEWRFRQQRR